MKTIEDLNKHANDLLDTIKEFNSNYNEEIFNAAPHMVHASFCSELVRIARKHEGEKMNEVPEFMEMLKAIEILEKLYPQLKKENRTA